MQLIVPLSNFLIEDYIGTSMISWTTHVAVGGKLRFHLSIGPQLHPFRRHFFFLGHKIEEKTIMATFESKFECVRNHLQ
ncbi:unnamed protein product [Blumeria hordei]|uniref:Uncharacterized protein n=1 Tax=Blumeria hordei TaxID=2867405 RepID=A0A383UYQ3_BLUHO|nr:unnamed protein product [Blumeria hordei]